MRNGLVRMTRIRGKTVVVSAICLGSKVRVEAACALDGEETAAAAAKARLMCLPYGKAILSMEVCPSRFRGQ